MKMAKYLIFLTDYFFKIDNNEGTRKNKNASENFEGIPGFSLDYSKIDFRKLKMS